MMRMMRMMRRIRMVMMMIRTMRISVNISISVKSKKWVKVFDGENGKIDDYDDDHKTRRSRAKGIDYDLDDGIFV